MKKLSLFILLIATIFISCSKDDDASDTVEITEANLIGKWQLTRIEEDGKEIRLDDCDKKDISQFSIRENGNKLAIFVENGESNGVCKPYTSTDYTWELSGNKFSTFILENTNRNYEDFYTIIELSKTILKLESKETYKDDQGNEKTSVYIETFTYVGKPDIEPSTSSNINETKLIGKWQYTGSTENGVADQPDECDLMDTIEFSKDKNGKSITFFTNTITTDGQTTTTCEIDGDSLFSWSLDGDQLTTSFGSSEEDSDTFTILEINSTTLKIEFVREDINQNGTVTKIIYVDIYKKI